MSTGYVLNDGVRVFKASDLEVRLRTGIWNYEEAVINLQDQSPEVSTAVLDIIDKMQQGIGINEESLNKYSLNKKDKEGIMELLNGLSYGEFIVDSNNSHIEKFLNSILLGSNYNIPQDVELKQCNKVLFISDNDSIKKYSMNLCEEMNFNIDILSDETLKYLNKVDLTTKTDALKVEKLYEEFNETLGQYDVFVVVMKYLNVTTMRNLNTLLVKWNKPSVISFLDGPFINLLVTNGSKTGCFQCFEQRALARIEDTHSYHTFVNSASYHINNENKGYYPILNILTNMAIMEAYQYTFVGTSKLSGRILGVYLPTLEIQVQSLLRVPYCSECGTVAKGKFEEINISSRRVLDEILSKKGR